jgi:hypothetical protein
MSKRKSKWWSREKDERTDDMAKHDKPTGAVAAGPATPITENPMTNAVKQMIDPNLLLSSLPNTGFVTEGTPASKLAALPPPPPEEILDPAGVLRLAMLEERMRRIIMESQARSTLYDAEIIKINTQLQVLPQQLEQLKANKQTDVSKLANDRAETGKEIQELREVLSKKHQIDLSLYGYNDVTGTLNLLPQSLPQSLSQQAGETQSPPVTTN